MTNFYLSTTLTHHMLLAALKPPGSLLSNFKVEALASRNHDCAPALPSPKQSKTGSMLRCKGKSPLPRRIVPLSLVLWSPFPWTTVTFLSFSVTFFSFQDGCKPYLMRVSATLKQVIKRENIKHKSAWKQKRTSRERKRLGDSIANFSYSAVENLLLEAY